MKDVVIEKPHNPTLWLVLLMIFFAVVSILSFVQIPKQLEIYNMELRGNYVEEEATIVKYEANFVKENIYNNYSVFYEYVDDEGNVYSGIWDGNVKKEQDAKAMIGQKVTIYVDHKEQIHAKSLPGGDSGAWAYGIMGGFCVLAFIVAFLREMLYVEQWRAYKKAATKLKSNSSN